MSKHEIVNKIMKAHALWFSTIFYTGVLNQNKEAVEIRATLYVLRDHVREIIHLLETCDEDISKMLEEVERKCREDL